MDQIEDFVRAGYEFVGVIGVSGSPLCGVRRTLDMNRATEFIAEKKLDDIERESMNAEGIRRAVVDGSGWLMEAVAARMRRRKLEAPLYEYDLMTELGGEKAPLPF